MSTVVDEDRDIKGMVNAKIAKLRKADRKPTVLVSDNGCKLIVTRYGNTEALEIEDRVAEELIAAGFAYGN